METTINYCEDGMAYISSDERRWHNRMNALAEQHREEVTIIKQPGENHGFIYGKFPQKWIKVSPPRQVIMTEEKREILRKNLQSIRENRRKD
jgi:hypothetical protein